MEQVQPLDSPVYRKVDTPSPVKPTVGRCKDTGHMPDADVAETCIYGCGEGER